MSSSITSASSAQGAARPVAFFCSHTHWDREWYGTFQEYRYRLVRLMDRLMDLLDRDSEFRCFNLDGQTVLLEDYLEVKPEQRERLTRFIRQGRLSIGPWYILPDEFLVSGESTVRNMLRGRRICRDFGVPIPSLGYLPDMFGHVSQMPQILRGFGIDHAIFWRGLSGDELKSEIWWEGPDGSRILGFHLPEYCGYCNAAFFYTAFPPEARTKQPEPHYWTMMSDDTEWLASALGAAIDRGLGRSRSNVLLLMNGIDHMEAQPQVPTVLQALRAGRPDVEIRHATFLEFANALRQATPEDLQVVHGELRATASAEGSFTFVLPNCLSARIQLKQMNARCQTLLERWAEPFETFASALAGTTPATGLLDVAWKHLLLNHPHDSICGCSVDPVHRQMEGRFEQSAEVAEILTSAALTRISARIDTSAWSEKELAFTLFNPLNLSVSDAVEVELDIEEDWLVAQGLPFHPENLYRTFRDLAIMEADGSGVDYELLSTHYVTVHKPWLEHFVPNRAVVRCRVLLQAYDLPPCGWKTYRVAMPSKPKRLRHRLSTGDPFQLDFGTVSAYLAENGTFDLSTQKISDALIQLHYFEDGGDNGDSYTYSPPRHDALVTSLGSATRLETLVNTPTLKSAAVEWSLDLPQGLSADRQHRSDVRVSQKIRSVYRLAAQSRRVDIETTLTNVAKDHRLQVCFPIDPAGEVEAGYHEAGMPFDIVQRPDVVDQPTPDQWIEDAPLERPLHGWVRVGGLAVLTDGLPEYEVVVGDDGRRVLKITLLRAVNWLGSGGHANTIAFGAGPHMETPDQQLLGRSFTFRYAVMPVSIEETDSLEIAREAAQFTALWRGIVHKPCNSVPVSPLPASDSLLRVDGDGVLLSAVKPGVEPGTVAVRFWNAGINPSTARVQWLAGGVQQAHWANLAEETLAEAVPTADGSYETSIGSKSIMTLLLTLQR